MKSWGKHLIDWRDYTQSKGNSSIFHSEDICVPEPVRVLGGVARKGLARRAQGARRRRCGDIVDDEQRSDRRATPLRPLRVSAWRASAALPLLDDGTASPASRRLASALASPGTRHLLILGQAPDDAPRCRLSYAALHLPHLLDRLTVCYRAVASSSGSLAMATGLSFAASLKCSVRIAGAVGRRLPHNRTFFFHATAFTDGQKTHCGGFYSIQNRHRAKSLMIKSHCLATFLGSLGVGGIFQSAAERGRKRRAFRFMESKRSCMNASGAEFSPETYWRVFASHVNPDFSLSAISAFTLR